MIILTCIGVSLSLLNTTTIFYDAAAVGNIYTHANIYLPLIDIH